MKKYNVALIACALLALALCLVPTRAFADEDNLASQTEQGEEFATPELVDLTEDELAGEEPANDELAEEELANDELAGEEPTGTDDAHVVVQSGEAVPIATPVANMTESNQDRSARHKRMTSHRLEGTLAKHYVGDELNCNGLTWAITYDDGSVERVPVDSSAVDGYDKHTAGMQGLSICQWHGRDMLMSLITVTVKERHASIASRGLDKALLEEMVPGSGMRYQANSGVYVQLETRYSMLSGSGSSQWEFAQRVSATDPKLEGRYQSDAAGIGRVVFKGQRTPATIDFGANKLPIGGSLSDEFVVACTPRNLYAYPLSQSAYSILTAAS